MIGHDIKIVIRNILRNKYISLIKISGLALGMACCIVIFLYVHNELAYDAFHDNADNIYRIAEDRTVPAGHFRKARISPLVGKILDDYPQVDQTARLYRIRNGMVKFGQQHSFPERLFYADPSLFDVFSIPFVKGRAKDALLRPRTAVITREIADMYSPNENPVGKRFQLLDPTIGGRSDNGAPLLDYEITGVVENSRSNTHFKFDIIASAELFANNSSFLGWDNSSAYTYVKLSEGVDALMFEDQIKRLAYTYYGEKLNAWKQERNYFLQPVKDIHFKSRLAGFSIGGEAEELEPPGQYLFIYIYASIAVMILLIGCLNYINLTATLSIRRSREVGVKKTFGVTRSQLIRQFISESMAVAVISFAIALLFAGLFVGPFNSMANADLDLYPLLERNVIIALFVLVTSVGLGAGLYPAFIMSLLKPVTVLKSVKVSGKQGSGFVRFFVIAQFVISILFAICTLAMHSQLDFMRTQELGFSKEQKYIIPFRNNRKLSKDYLSLKAEMARHPMITGSTVSSGIPGRSILKNNLRVPGKRHDPSRQLSFIDGDCDFVNVYQIPVVAGRAMMEDRGDKNGGILVNESAVALLGFESAQEAVGTVWQECYTPYQRAKEIVGVVKDFYYEGMQQEVEPLFIEHSGYRFNYLTLNMLDQDVHSTLDFVSSRWKEMYPDIPLEGFFLDEDYDRQYHSEIQAGRLLGFVSLIALFVACTGLSGLASFIVQQRTKEIGIRKVLGASLSQVYYLLAKKFIFLVFIAGLFAVPVSWFVVKIWLENFAYRSPLNIFLFILPVAGALIIAFAAISAQVIKVLLIRPVVTLRYE